MYKPHRLDLISNKADSESGTPPCLTLPRSTCVRPDCGASQLVPERCSAGFWDFTLKLFPRAPVITYNYPASHCGREGDTVDTLYTQSQHIKGKQTQEEHKTEIKVLGVDVKM
ncbi:hypothetical protein JOQ06_012559 [Pogonophryne albipinna]|uniref:Uncharacterized protein n=1 Tax=Pogonophryne albipinna TaxID=1090488 RepID=A0AAD6BHY2_9TELE|nr:hypothetical protein JOQ06_012559 [Pogonophryne albipinna]